MLERWPFTVLGATNRRSAILGLVRPSAVSRTTSRSVGVRLAHPEDGRFRPPRPRLAYATASSIDIAAPSAQAGANASRPTAALTHGRGRATAATRRPQP